ncbi:hypothetical protein LX32DRAFT_325065 [Colletotrichum zoysiae]|uniref:Uncharacterized protein n=1 Tax=Colletotrichum zoysiae TaxID=1216348 RepID=A0AAD9M2D9_9PEZI|nr:hypothetical protein LX32DRAFT_325065 [Colletotrichum zoysiae]
MSHLLFPGDSFKAWLSLDLCLALSPSADSFRQVPCPPQFQWTRDARPYPGCVCRYCLTHGPSIFPSNVSSFSTYITFTPPTHRPQRSFTAFAFKKTVCGISFTSVGSRTILAGVFLTIACSLNTPNFTASL